LRIDAVQRRFLRARHFAPRVSSQTLDEQRRNMKKTCTTLIIAIAISKVAFSGCNAPPADQPKILTMEAVDTSTTAGTRKSTSTLVMVSSGSARTADITITTAGTIGAGYPTCSAGVTASAGDYTASFSGSADKSVTATVKDDSGDCSASKSVSIDIVVESKVSGGWDFDGDKLKPIQDSINGAINKITGGTGDHVDVSGSLAVEFKRVDKYNTGSSYGYYAYLDGTITGSFSDISITSPEFVIVPGVSIALTGGFSASSISLNSKATWDQSLATEGTISGTVSGSTTASVGAKGVLGVSKIASATITVTGSTTLSASGSITVNNQAVVASGSVGASDFTVQAVGELETIIGDKELFNEIHKFEYEVSKPFSAVLHTFS